MRIKEATEIARQNWLDGELEIHWIATYEHLPHNCLKVDYDSPIDKPNTNVILIAIGGSAFLCPPGSYHGAAEILVVFFEDMYYTAYVTAKDEIALLSKLT